MAIVNYDPQDWRPAFEPAAVAGLRNQLATDPKATDEKRYEALRLAADHTHATPDEVVKRAQAYFEFLKGE
jgi:hypothetical protein